MDSSRLTKCHCRVVQKVKFYFFNHFSFSFSYKNITGSHATSRAVKQLFCLRVISTMRLNSTLIYGLGAAVHASTSKIRLTNDEKLECM